MKKILTLGFILFFAAAGAQTLGGAVTCNGHNYYVRTTFTDIFVPAHPVSTTNCPDGSVHDDTEEGEYTECRMELFADAGYTQPVAVDPRFFSFARDLPGSVGTAANPSVIYRYQCPAPLPAGSEYGGNFRIDRNAIYIQQCIWECVGSGYYSCYITSFGEPVNYNIVINCCYAPELLAVRLVSFSGLRSGSVNTLSWGLVDTTDFSKMEVERSQDGINFSVVYSSLDAAVPSFSDQVDVTAYYRIQVYDKNGSSFYSSVVVLKAVVDLKKSFSVSPSPFVREMRVMVTSPFVSKAVFKLMAADGRVVFFSERMLRVGVNSFVIDVPPVARGLYILTMSDGDGMVSKKVFKQ